MIPRTLLLDMRHNRGPIEVLQDGERIAYAVPANAGDHWAVYTYIDGQRSWDLEVAPTGDAARDVLAAMVERIQTAAANSLVAANGSTESRTCDPLPAAPGRGPTSPLSPAGAVAQISACLVAVLGLLVAAWSVHP